MFAFIQNLEECTNTCIHLKDVNSHLESSTHDHFDHTSLFNKVFSQQWLGPKKYSSLARSNVVQRILVLFYPKVNVSNNTLLLTISGCIQRVLCV